MGLQTEFDFTLPKGYIDRDGVLHRHGTMRLATARDEIEPLRDPRVTSADDPYLTILVIARVVTELGTAPEVTADVVEGLFAADLAFLQDLYGIINFGNPADVAELQAAVLPPEPVEVVAVAPEPFVEQVDDDDLEPLRDLVDAAPRRRGRIEEVGSRTGS